MTREYIVTKIVSNDGAEAIMRFAKIDGLSCHKNADGSRKTQHG